MDFQNPFFIQQIDYPVAQVDTSTNFNIYIPPGIYSANSSIFFKFGDSRSTPDVQVFFRSDCFPSCQKCTVVWDGVEILNVSDLGYVQSCLNRDQEIPGSSFFQFARQTNEDIYEQSNYARFQFLKIGEVNEQLVAHYPLYLFIPMIFSQQYIVVKKQLLINLTVIQGSNSVLFGRILQPLNALIGDHRYYSASLDAYPGPGGQEADLPTTYQLQLQLYRYQQEHSVQRQIPQYKIIQTIHNFNQMDNQYDHVQVNSESPLKQIFFTFVSQYLRNDGGTLFDSFDIDEIIGKNKNFKFVCEGNELIRAENINQFIQQIRNLDNNKAIYNNNTIRLITKTPNTYKNFNFQITCNSIFPNYQLSVIQILELQ